MARFFLWTLGVLAALLLAAALVWRFYSAPLLQWMLKPPSGFSESATPPPPDYRQQQNWLTRPDIAGNPALFAPEGYRPAPHPAAALFFVSPTAWFGRAWNAPLDDAATNERLDRFASTQASAFNSVAAIWIPRYRQAAYGAFLAPGPDSVKALGLAYQDVERAFDAFLAAQPADRPILLAGHSQGALHLLHLLKARRAAIGDRLVAVYAAGWPVVEPGDSQLLGVPPCASATATGCLLSWQSYAADGALKAALETLAPVVDLSGAPIGARPMLCVNPITGDGAAAPAARNLGALDDTRLLPHLVGAECSPEGLLLIAPTPALGNPAFRQGGNFHVYDYALFWANIRADAEARLSAHASQTLGQPPSQPVSQPQ